MCTLTINRTVYNVSGVYLFIEAICVAFEAQRHIWITLPDVCLSGNHTFLVVMRFAADTWFPWNAAGFVMCHVKDTPNFISSGSKIVKRLRRRQYDPVIIERTIGLVLGPSTALYEPFLKHCTLTNKAVGTIWRALSKPPQRRQGPDLCPLWLLVGTP